MNPAQTAAVTKACALVGGKTALARHLGVQPPTVQQWVEGKRPVPADKCTAIDILTGGAVSRRDLHEKWREIWPELAVAMDRDRDEKTVCALRMTADSGCSGYDSEKSAISHLPSPTNA